MFQESTFVFARDFAHFYIHCQTIVWHILRIWVLILAKNCPAIDSSIFYLCLCCFYFLPRSVGFDSSLNNTQPAFLRFQHGYLFVVLDYDWEVVTVISVIPCLAVRGHLKWGLYLNRCPLLDVDLLLNRYRFYVYFLCFLLFCLLSALL